MCTLRVCEQHLLRAHKDVLDAGHKALLQKEVLMGDEVDQLVSDYPPTELPPRDDGLSANGGPGGASARELSVTATA